MSPADIILVLVAYLFGAFPFSQLVARWRTGLNLREVGEGNVGSRNVWHVAGPQWGLAAFALDMLKGLAAVELAQVASAPAVVVLLCGVAAMLGHQFPLFLRGRGGKGLATGAGALLAVTPLSVLGGLALLGLVYLITRNFNPSVTLGVIAMILLPLALREPFWVAGYTLVLALLAGLKKMLDRPHEQKVWARDPWEGPARPGFTDEGGDQAPQPDERAR
ncbi:MAG: glycerol-3-phosphate acyltransferase [Ktedonobacterales bacterium]|jgi:glycerol-3-phosphate acyltransferase PlsY